MMAIVGMGDERVWLVRRSKRVVVLDYLNVINKTRAVSQIVRPSSFPLCLFFAGRNNSFECYLCV